MAEDAELEVVLVPDESSLQDVQNQLSVEGDDSGKSGGEGGVLGLLGGMGKKLTAILGVIGAFTMIPGVLDGIMRILEVALLPITALFAALLAPLLKKLMRWLVENDIIGQIQDFAERVVQKIVSFVDSAMQIASQIQGFVSSITDSWLFGGPGPTPSEENMPPSLQRSPGTGGQGTVSDPSVLMDTPVVISPQQRERSSSTNDQWSVDSALQALGLGS